MKSLTLGTSASFDGQGLPSGWIAARLKLLLTEPMSYGANESADSDDPNNPRYVRITDIDSNGSLREDTFRSLPVDVAAPYLLLDGDLLFARSGATVGKTLLYSKSWGQCCYAGYLIRARVDQEKILPEYLKYFTMTNNYWQHIHSEQIQATIQNVSAERFGNLLIPVPPNSTQREIVTFLNRETSKINCLIANQEKLIATLREDRIATITNAVTKGMNPSVEMTESGIKWIGPIPIHWRISQIRYMVSRIEQGISPQAYEELVDENNWGVLKSGCVNGGVFADVQHKKLPADLEFDRALAVKPGDLLVCRASGSRHLVGSTALVRELRFQLIMSDKIFRLTPAAEISSEYLNWVMNSSIYREQVNSSISGAEGLANNLPSSALKGFRFAIPPAAEQDSIARFLNDQCTKIDNLIAKTNDVISVLREYRSAIITAAVTGKIDVQGSA